MDDDCACVFNSDCRSGRCEGIKPRICEARLGIGSYCNEDSDCISGHCSWRFQCQEPSGWWGSRSEEEKDSEAAAASVSRAIDMDDDNVVAEDQGGGNGTAGKILMATILTVLVIGIGRWCYVKKRRHGYEEVPAQLVV